MPSNNTRASSSFARGLVILAYRRMYSAEPHDAKAGIMQELTCRAIASIVAATSSFPEREDTNDYGLLQSQRENRPGAGHCESLVHCLCHCADVTRARCAPGGHVPERAHWGRSPQA